MAQTTSTPNPLDPQQEILVRLEEIRRQNIVLKRYLFVIIAGLTLLLLLQTDMVSTIVNYVIIILIVMAVMLTAPWWSHIIVSLTDRIPWYPKKRN